MKKILLIDDEESILQTIMTGLSMYGYVVEGVLDGEKGLQLFEAEDFDLVITDLFMPGINGNEIAHHVRTSRKPFTPIIGISGNTFLFNISRFDAIVQKPFLIKTLIESIECLLRNQPLFEEESAHKYGPVYKSLV